jgi:hypothetical protein
VRSSDGLRGSALEAEYSHRRRRGGRPLAPATEPIHNDITASREHDRIQLRSVTTDL